MQEPEKQTLEDIERKAAGGSRTTRCGEATCLSSVARSEASDDRLASKRKEGEDTGGRGGIEGDGEPADDGADQASEPLENFVQEAMQARSALDLYTDLSTGGIDALRKRIGTLRDR